MEFWEPATLLKQTPTQVFPCEIYKLFKNKYFEEHLWTSASKHYLERDSNSVESYFAEHLLAITSHMMLFLQISDVCSLKPIYLVEQWKIRGGNPQARSILCSYGDQVETSLSSCRHTCTYLDILIAGEVERKEELKNLLICGKFSFHFMVYRELSTYLKNKKFLFVNY